MRFHMAERAQRRTAIQVLLLNTFYDGWFGLKLSTYMYYYLVYQEAGAFVYCKVCTDTGLMTI